MTLLDLPLDELTARARAVRAGTRVTYSPKVFVPLTRLCRDRCGYCTLATAPAHLPSPYLSPDECWRSPTRGPQPAATMRCSPSASSPSSATPRIAYHGLIDNVQASWVKLGAVGAGQLLAAGVNDLGGTLMDGNIGGLALPDLWLAPRRSAMVLASAVKA